ncbi:hypothetical protein ACNKHX_02145 [Shigella flexneri]
MGKNLIKKTMKMDGHMAERLTGVSEELVQHEHKLRWPPLSSKPGIAAPIIGTSR